MLEKRICLQKEALRVAKPFGYRLDQVRAALERARQRSAEAEKAVQTAILLQEQTKADADQCLANVRELEAAIAKQDEGAASMSVDGGDHPPPPPPGQQSDEAQLHEVLGRMLSGLRADPWTAPQVVANAESSVAQLMAGLKMSIAQAKEAKEAAAVAENGGNPVHRMQGKQPLPQEAPLARVRHGVKQPPRKLLTNYFKVMVGNGKLRTTFLSAKSSAANAN